MLGFHWRRRVERLENHLGLMRLHATWSIPKKVHWSPKSEYGLTTTVLQVLLCKSTLKSAVLLQLKFLGSRCDFLNIVFSQPAASRRTRKFLVAKSSNNLLIVLGCNLHRSSNWNEIFHRVFITMNVFKSSDKPAIARVQCCSVQLHFTSP